MKVTLETSLSDLARIFDRDHFALVVTTQRLFAGRDLPPVERSVVFGVVSRIDLLKYITDSAPEGSPRDGTSVPFHDDGAAAGGGGAGSSSASASASATTPSRA